MYLLTGTIHDGPIVLTVLSSLAPHLNCKCDPWLARSWRYLMITDANLLQLERIGRLSRDVKNKWHLAMVCFVNDGAHLKPRRASL